MKRKVDIQPGDIVATGANIAGIRNSDVATYLARDSADAISDLSNLYGNIDASQISIDANGVVIIDTDDFRSFAKDTINNPVAPVAGWGCANGGCM